jgi:hypothetical protein
MYPNVGHQYRISAGIFAKIGILNIQFKPEFVRAANKQFSTFPIIWYNTNNQRLVQSFFDLVNGIDAPERFGRVPINKFYPGQSKITLSYKGFEAGVSTENLWWGPSIRNSIMMSNSAPGFLHWTFNSSRPVKTPVGSFEWQLIGGKLTQSGYAPLDTGMFDQGDGLWVPKPKLNRYLSAFTVNWQPKWIHGFFVGVTGFNYLNKDEAFDKRSILKKALPVFFRSSQESNTIEAGDSQDFAYSLYFRQLLTKYNAEIFFEVARNDRFSDFVDFLSEPEHSVAYTIGGSKIFKLNDDRGIQVKMELTKLENSPTYLVRATPNWYVHPTDPRDGYTNQGRYVGAGIGPGSNSFMTDISYFKGLNSIGINLERIAHNNDLYYNIYSGTGTFNANWVDLAPTLYVNAVLYKKLLLNFQYARVYQVNYQYYVVPDPKQNQTYFSHIGFGINYTF